MPVPAIAREEEGRGAGEEEAERLKGDDVEGKEEEEEEGGEGEDCEEVKEVGV